MSRAAVIVITTLIAVTLAQPGLARFGADPAASEWSSVAGTNGCHLVHEIPRFGTLIITQHGDLTFDGLLVTRRPPAADRRGRVTAVSPAWKVVRTTRALPPIQASPSLNTVRFDEQAVRLLVTGLEQGDFIVLRFADWAGDSLEAALSPVGFRPALRRHLECLAGGTEGASSSGSAGGNGASAAIGSAGGGAVMGAAMTTGSAARNDAERRASENAGITGIAGVAGDSAPVLIYFAHDNARLDRVDLDAIAAIAERLRTGAVWNRIVVTGHTDATGRRAYNEALGLARALEVRNRLIRLGIDADRIEVRTRAASRPVATNTTDYGRAANRRVEVRGEL